jgi:glycosyltransferase involved in cell wall biosynthesis
MMGEAQAKCGVEESDDLLLHFWTRQRRVLRRADKVSVSAHKQMYAVLGELGVLGRLGYRNAAHSFCSVLPIAADPMFLDLEIPLAGKKFRGDLFPDDTFAVLWTGGYNTWTDVETLAGALSMAMEQVPRMRFISTGGSIPGHNEGTYPKFQELMKRSGLLDLCHFLGWIPGEDVAPLYAECDLGLNIDGLNYETLLGGRNRLVNMMAAGLPVLTTLGTELSEIISDNRLGYVVRIGKVQEFADALVRASKISPERRQLGQRGRTYAKENFSPEVICRPILKWAAAPSLAPENAA